MCGVRLRGLIPDRARSEPGGSGPPIVGIEPGVRLFVGMSDDPFFLDLKAFDAVAQSCQGPGGTGANFFKEFNSSTIVLRASTALIGATQVGVWAHTMARTRAAYGRGSTAPGGRQSIPYKRTPSTTRTPGAIE